jgi:hypothetical protein
MEGTSGLICLQLALFVFASAVVVATARSVVCWRARQYLVSTTPHPAGAAMYATLFNPLRRSLGIRPLRVIPYIDALHRDEVNLLERADRLTREIDSALKHSTLSDIRKADCERQASAIPDNIVNSLWALSRLRRLGRLIDKRSDPDGQQRQAIAELEGNLRAEMERSVERLSGITVSLLQVELARSDDRVSRLAHDLDETNERLIDLSAGYAETTALSRSIGT